MIEKPNLIYISYYFPPIHSIASLRNYFLVTNFKNRFESCIVLSTSNFKLFPKEEKKIDEIDVKHLFTLDYRTILHLLQKKNTKGHFDEVYKKNSIIKFLIRLNETFPFNLICGEGGFFFILLSVRHILKLSKGNNVSYVISAYRPFANIVSVYIAKLFNNKIHWIISMHDVPINYQRPNSLWLNFQKYIWKKLFSKADKVITLSEGLSRDLINYGVNASVIQNGISIRTPESAQNKKFTISFTGSLYEGLFEPDVFLNVIEQMVKKNMINTEIFCINYIGKDIEFWDQITNKFPLLFTMLKSSPIVSHSESLNIQTHSNVNLLLSWRSEQISGVLTGKLFEYLGARNPILAIVNGTHDAEFVDLFDKFNCGLVVFNSDHAQNSKIENFIIKNYRLWLNGEYSSTYNPIEPLMAQSWPSQAEKYVKILFS